MAKLPKIEKAKQVGKNFITVIEGEAPLTITGDKEFLTPIKKAVADYQAKPTTKGLAEIKKLFTPAKEAEKAVKAVKAKEIKEKIVKAKEVKKKVETKVVKKSKEKVNLVKELQNQMVDGELSEKDADAMRALLAKSDEAKAKAAKATTSAPNRQSRREY